MNNNTRPSAGYQKGREHGGESQGTKSAPEGADAWHNPHNGELTTIRIFEHELHIKKHKHSTDSDAPPKRKKNDINRFSKKSRLRVLRKFNQLQTKVLSAPIFVSFAAKHVIDDPDEMKKVFLKSFLPRLENIIPNLVYAWRMEPHADGKPHFHFFAWSWDKERNLNSQYYRRQIRDLFADSIDDNSHAARRYGIKIKGVHSHRKAMAYVSKYMSKEDEVLEEDLTGRRWAVSTNFPAVPIAEITISRENARRIRRAAKRLLRGKGGRFAKVADDLDSFQDVFIWLDLPEIIALINEIPYITLPSEVIFYAKTGSTEPTEAFFEVYSDHFK